MFGNKGPRTPSQQAQRAQLGIVARLAGCGYLIYIMVKILRTPSDSTSPMFMTIIAIVMVALSIFVIIITIREFFIGMKIGRYKAETYEAAHLEEYLKKQAAEETGKTELIGTSGEDDAPENEDGNIDDGADD